MKKCLSLIIVLMLVLAQGCGSKDASNPEKDKPRVTDISPSQDDKTENDKPSETENTASDEETYESNEETNEHNEETTQAEEAAEKATGEENSEEEADGKIVEIPLESVNGISQEEATALCYEIRGSLDSVTGFPIAHGITGAVEKNGIQYYVLRSQWFVDNDHWSYIGNSFVTSDGKKLYDGIALGGEYEILNLLWSEQ